MRTRMKLLVTGGTTFVSRYVATYFHEQGHAVTVLNRGNKPQVEGVHVICADRHQLHDELKHRVFDAVLDICAYNEKDINDLLDALPEVKDYIFISSSAVYPETNVQPFKETQEVGPNRIWGAYGTDKIAAEQALLKRIPQAYILRPPYLYGPMQNVYREPFVFECALKHRPFYIPKDGKMKLQFFHVKDLCVMMERILNIHPDHHIYNVGNEEAVDINTFVKLCYEVVEEPLTCKHVYHHKNQRDYFSFYDYEYELDITNQKKLLPKTIPLLQGLKESYEWYCAHQNDVIRKNLIPFIDEHFASYQDTIVYEQRPEFDQVNDLIAHYFQPDGYEVCLKELLKIAGKGYSLAQCQVGYFYMEGYGTERNEKLGFYWTMQAAVNGDHDAAENVGACYEKGIGTKVDLEQAKTWYRIAIQRGSKAAIECLKNLIDK